jgi:hypothetical protein
MQQVLSGNLWKIIRAQGAKARHRRAVIAYVTQDLVGLRKGDVLVVDASERAIACGETAATLLRRLKNKGVRIYHCAGLHAKVLLLGDVAVVSSGNMSNSSADGLIEAGLMMDHCTTVSAVSSFIEQVIRRSNELLVDHIAALNKIKVVRRHTGIVSGHENRRTKLIRPLGYRTWLVGVHELVRDPRPEEQRLIEHAMQALRRRTGSSDSEPDWIRWGISSRFARECREGDSIIQIWRANRAKRPSVVIRPTPVLLKQRTKKWTRFYLGEATGPHTDLSLHNFKNLLKQLGYSRPVSAGIQHLVEPEMADAIGRKWKTRRI